MSVTPQIGMTLGSTTAFPSASIPLDLSFANAGTAPGYGPFLALNLGTSGLTLPSSMTTNLGETVTPVKLTDYSSSLGGFIIPGTSDNGDGPAVVPAASSSDAVYLLELPFGSYAGGQTPVTIATSVTVPANSAVGAADSITLSGGFQYGSVAISNTPIIATAAPTTITTSLINVTDTQSGSPTLGGSNGLTWSVYGNVALGATVDNLSLTDPLPPLAVPTNFTVSDGKGNSWTYTVSGGVVTTITPASGNKSGAVEPAVTTASAAATAGTPNVYYNAATNSITANFGNYEGESSNVNATDPTTAPSISANFTLPTPVLGSASGSAIGTADLQVTDELPYGATAQTFTVTGPNGTYNYSYSAANGVQLVSESAGAGAAPAIETAGPGTTGTDWVYYDVADGKIEADFGAGLPAGSTGSISAAWQNGQQQSPGYISTSDSDISDKSSFTQVDQLAGGQTVNTVTISNGSSTYTYDVSSSGVLTEVGTGGPGIGVGNADTANTIWYDTANNRIVVNWGNVSSASSSSSWSIDASNSGSTEVNQDSSTSTTVTGIIPPSAGYSYGSGTVQTVYGPADSNSPTPTGSNSVTAELVGLSKSVSVVTDNAPGGELKWTINGSVSNYADVNNIVVTDTLSSGQTFDPTKDLTLVVNSNGSTYNLTFDNTDYSTSVDPATGVTTILFDVSTALTKAGVSLGDINGGAAPTDNSVAPTAANFTIVYDSTIDKYFDGSNYAANTPVNQNDNLPNQATMTGTLVGTNTPVSASASASDTLPDGEVSKTVYAVNGYVVNAVNIAAGNVVMNGSTPEVKAGDVVTYDVQYTLPQTDTSDLTLTDYMPLPVLSTTNADGNGDGLAFVANPTNEFAAGVVTYGPDENITGTESITTPVVVDNAATNSFSINLGAFTTTTNAPSTVDLLVSSVVSDQPFVNGLDLTNEVTGVETSSQGATDTTNAIAQIELVQPELDVFKSVTAISGSGAHTEALTGSTSASTFNGLFNATTGQLTGTITNANVGDLVDSAKGAQGGDQVNFAIAVQNVGGAAAFNIDLADQLPAGITAADVSNITLTNGAGQSLDLAAGSSLANLFTTGVTLAAFDGLSPDTATDGSNIAVVTYTVNLPTNVSLPDLTETNKATVSSFTAQTTAENPTPPNFADAANPGTLSASANVVTAIPSISKTVIGTGLDPVGTTNAAADKGDLQVGEQVTYQVTTTLDEGTYSDLQLTDLLPTDLTNVTVSGFTVGADISTTLTPADVTGTGSTLSADFGQTVVTNNAGTAADQITFTVTGDATAPSGSTDGGDTTSFSNKGQVIATNSAGAGYTVNSSVSVTEKAPNLTLTKGVADLTTQGNPTTPTFTTDTSVNAGDTVEYKLALSDASGSNPAFNVAISDAVNTELAGGVTLNAGSIEVLNADGSINTALTAAANAASSTSVGTTISQIDAGQTYTVEFKGTVTSTDAYNTSYTNQASFSGSTLATTTPGASETVSGNSNDAVVTTPVPTSTKALTSVSDTTLNTANGTTGNDIEPGDVGTYTVTVTLPEGTSSDLSLQDLLPTGLTYVAGSAAISSTGAGVTTGTLAESAITGGFKLDLGAVTATQASSVTITYQALVSNTITADETLTNTINTYTAGTLVNTTTANASVVLPTDTIVKTATADAANVTTATQTGDAGYVEDYSIVVTPTNDIPGYDLSIADNLPAGETLVAGSVVSSAGTVTVNGSNITVNGLDTSNGNGFLTGSTPITITYKAVVANGSTAGETITNNASVTESTAPTGGESFTSNATASFTVPAGSLSGTVFLDNNANGSQDNVGGTDSGIAGDTVTLYEVGTTTAIASTTTNSSGYYNFGNLSQGSYYVEIGQDGYAGYSPNGTSTTSLNSVDNGNGTTSAVNVYAGQNTPNQNAGLYNLGSLSGEVFADANNDGILDQSDTGVGGEKVELLLNGNVVATTTTSSTAGSVGDYQFTGLVPADYQVEIVTTPSQSISTPIFTSSSNSQIDNLAEQNGLIPGGTNEIPVYSGENTPHQDAGITNDGSVSGLVFFDGNCNGIYHVGDAGVAGVTVNLINASGQVVATTLTGDSGSYQFLNVEVGNYSVQVEAPQGTSFSHTELANGQPLIDSDVDKNGFTSTLTVVADQNNADANAGLIFNGDFADVTPITLAAGQAYASLNGGQVVTSYGNGANAGGNTVITGGPGESVVTLSGNDNSIELGVDASGTAEDIGTSCGTLNAQTLRSADGFLFAGGTGSSGLDGGPGYSYLMAGTGANQVYSGTGTNVIIAGGNGSALTVGGLSTTIYYEAGDGTLYVEGGLRSVDSLTVYGYAGGTVTSVGGMEELQLGNGDVIDFVGPTSLATGYTTGEANLHFVASVTAPPVEELSFVNGLPVFTDPGTTALPAVSSTPVPTSPATPVVPTPPVVTPTPPATVATTTSGSDVVVGSTTTTVTLAGYNNNVTGASATGVSITGDQGSSTYNLGGGNNDLVLNGYSDDITLGDGNNTVSGTAGSTTIAVGSGDNTITAAGYYNTITTGGGTNTITAGNGNDTVNSGASTDNVTLAGWSNIVTVGTGSDTVAGGAGNTYTLDNVAGSFNVADFSLANSDVLNLSAVTTDPTKVLITAVSASETDVSVISGGSTYLVADLHGVAASSLTVGHGITI